MEVGYEVLRFPISMDIRYITMDMYLYIHTYIYVYKSGVVVLEFVCGGLHKRAFGDP